MEDNVRFSEQYEVVRIVTGGKWKENCYLIIHNLNGDMLLLDPGDDADEISKYINGKNGNLKAIILTHAHHDHIGAAQEISHKFNVKCYLSKLDARLLRQAPMYAVRFAGKEVVVPDRIELYENTKELFFDGFTVKINPSPGHTPGSVCYFLDGMLFTGDTLFYEHVGRTDLPGASEKQIIESVNQILSQFDDTTLILPGHGENWDIMTAKQWWKVQIKPMAYNRFE